MRLHQVIKLLRHEGNKQQHKLTIFSMSENACKQHTS